MTYISRTKFGTYIHIYIYIIVNIYKSNGILMPGLVGSDLSEFAVGEAGKWRHQQSSESSESSA